MNIWALFCAHCEAGSAHIKWLEVTPAYTGSNQSEKKKNTKTFASG